MAFALSFSNEFFQLEGDEQLMPVDAGGEEIKEPLSVYQGLIAKTTEEWNEIAKEVFGLDDGEFLEIHTVMDKIRETDTCFDLSSPVQVYIDKEGYYSVFIYDQ